MSEEEAERWLLAELEEWLKDDDVLGLYIFWWSLADTGLPDDAKQRVCECVYAELRRRHDLQLVWLHWPTNRAPAVPADDRTTVLEFDMDPDGPIGEPFLALIEA